MTPSRKGAPRESATGPSTPERHTFELIRRIFSVMMENLGMTESCIMQNMTSERVSTPQIREALNMAVEMGMLNLRAGQYKFGMTYFEDVMAEGCDADVEFVHAVRNRARNPVPCQSSRGLQDAALSSSRVKRMSSAQGPKSSSKRQRLSNSQVPKTSKSTYQQHRSRLDSSRSSTSSLQSDSWSYAGNNRGNKTVARRSTTKTGKSGGYKRTAVDSQRGKGTSAKRKTKKAVKAKPKKGVRPGGNRAPDKRTRSPTWYARHDEPSTSRGPTKSSYRMNNQTVTSKCKKSDTSVTSKKSAASQESGKTNSSHRSASSGGSRKAVVPKIPSRTSRRSDEPSGSSGNVMMSRSQTRDILQTFLQMEWVADRIVPNDCDSSVGSRRSNASWASAYSDDSGDEVPVNKSKTSQSNGRKVKKKDSESSIESNNSSCVTRSSSKMSCSSNEQPESSRSTHEKKPETAGKSQESIKEPQASRSSIANRGSKTLSKQSVKSENPAEPKEDTETKGDRRSLRQTNSSSSVGSEKSDVSKVSSVGSVRSVASGDHPPKSKSKTTAGNNPADQTAKRCMSASTYSCVKDAKMKAAKSTPVDVPTTSRPHTLGSGVPGNQPQRSKSKSNKLADQAGPSTADKCTSVGWKAAKSTTENAPSTSRPHILGNRVPAPRLPSTTRFIGGNQLLHPTINEVREEEEDTRSQHDFYR